MDNKSSCRDIVRQTILKYAGFRPSHGDIRLDTIFDEAKDRYALVQVGWDRGRRVRGLLLYVTVSENGVCIEYDGMEHGISYDLIRKRIPEQQIEFAYMRSELF